MKPKIEKKKDAKKLKKQGIEEGKADLNLVDMEDDKQIEQINSKEINIDDEAVKDRWSRYIGAMGIEAVAKQANA